jgi:adenine-specific DNA glycosylase
MEHANETAIRQRTGKDIWQQLYEFPMIEKNKEENLKTVLLRKDCCCLKI